jgi:polyhydroxyalkanoate synthesis repressor PhaR
MTNVPEPTIIKKYANRRLYHTGTSTYVTQDDLAQMVRKGEEFVVQDAKTGEDITRPVLGQIIMDEENKDGQGLLPISFLRQLIRLYGDSMQNLVPGYLNFSLEALMREQQSLREKMAQTVGTVSKAMSQTPFGENPFANTIFKALDEQAKNNMAIYGKAFEMFNPLNALNPQMMRTSSGQATSSGATEATLDELKRQINELQAKLDQKDKP